MLIMGHADEYCTDQGYFKPVLINTAMLDLAYNQSKSIYIGTIPAIFLPSHV